MITRRLCFLFACCLLLLAGCQKKEEVSPIAYDKAIIGKSYGFTGTSKSFLVNSDGVYPQLAYLNGMPEFDSVSLPADKQALAREILNRLPAYLYSHPNTQFACPNCADQSALYIEVYHDGTATSWTIDLVDEYIPKELKSFAQYMSASMDQL